MHTDSAKEFTQGCWQEILSQHGGIKQTFAEPYSPWQNQAEAGIQEHKKQVLRVLRQTRASKHLWDYAAIYVAEVRSCTAHQLYELHGRTPYEIVAGDTPDITEWLEYDFYQPVWFYSPAAFPVEKQLLGRWLGVVHRVGQALCYWILPVSGS